MVLNRVLYRWDDRWCRHMAAQVAEARAHFFFVHVMLLPYDIDEEDVITELGRMMRHQKDGWDMVVIAMSGTDLEAFPATEQLFNTVIRENEEPPALLFQSDVRSRPLWMHLQRGADAL